MVYHYILYWLAILAAVSGADEKTCAAQQQGQNCWGEDLEGGGAAASAEECCDMCAATEQCEYFVFDQWDPQGKASSWCFLKSSCSDPRPSPSALLGRLNRTSPSTTTLATTTTTTTVEAGSTTRSAPRTCAGPTSVDTIADGEGWRENVSSWEECCQRCVSPCTAVTFGQYRNRPNLWACYLYGPSSQLRASALLSRSGLVTDAPRSCSSQGLERCQTSEMRAMEWTEELPPPSWLGATAAGALLIALPLGFCTAARSA